MARYLNIVENAYRATIEEQDDTCLWFAHAQKNAGADVAVLLRGNAVNYAVKGQRVDAFNIGTYRLNVPPEIEKDVSALVGKKVPVYLVSEDATDRGIQATDLVAGVEHVSRAGLGKLVDGFDRVYHW